MTELKQYKCEKCGTVYSDRSECKKCESNHAEPKNFARIFHKPYKVCAVYPYRIEVEFDNGKKRLYELKSPDGR